jgi:hypothetical protein
MLPKLLHRPPFSSNTQTMQISKSLLVGCAAVVCIFTQTVRAADTDAQVKAREALRGKMNELQGQPASLDTTPQQAAPAPAPQKKKKSPPVATEKQKGSTKPAMAAVPAPAETAMPEVVAAPPPDSEATARQRDAVRKKMDELVAHEPVPAMPNQAPPVMTKKPTPTTSPRPVTPQVQTRPVRPRPTPPMEEPAKVAPSAVPTAPAPVATQPATATPPQGQQAPAVAPSTAPTPAAPVVAQPAPARQQPTSQFQEPPPTYKSSNANERQQAEQAASLQAEMKPKAESKQKKSTKPVRTFQPMQGPELNISPDKQERLNELLRRYQADEITPGQYHEERAKILGAQ